MSKDNESRPAAPRCGGPRIGVVSDTHGFLDPYVLEVFAGVDRILHAGDVMDASILESLAEVAPVIAVAGNLDGDKLGGSLPTEAIGEIDGVTFVLSHKRKRLMKRLSAGKIDVGGAAMPDLVVFGHEHIPSASWVDTTLFLNPGSASAPYEEDDMPTVAVVERCETGLSVTFVPLDHRELDDKAPVRVARGDKDRPRD